LAQAILSPSIRGLSPPVFESNFEAAMTLAQVFRATSLISAALAVHQGALRIEQDGQTLDLHVVALAEKGSMFFTNGRALTMKWGGELRGFLAERRTDDMPADNYFNVTLLNKEISYDIDLGSVGCSCNAALFFVSMPGYSPDGSIAHGDWNPYYCDANQIGGVWCWEHDTIEGNMHAMASTPHTCSAPPGEYIDSCDKIGCATHAMEMDPKGFCPDADCTIDTRKPFRIHQRYEANRKGQLTRIANRLTQEGRVFTWDACMDPAYLEKMTPAFSNKMSMVFQLWGDTYENMSWLDKMTGCKGACDVNSTQVTFSDIVIRSMAPEPDDAAVVVV